MRKLMWMTEPNTDSDPLALDYTATTILEKFQNETTTQNLEKSLKAIAVAKTEEALAVSFGTIVVRCGFGSDGGEVNRLGNQDCQITTSSSHT